ncbi:MAG: arginine repressor [Chloroflexota bacterium]
MTEDLRKPLARRQLIRRLIATGEIHSQDQIVAELAQRAVKVTQATISRDFAELGVVRGVRNGQPVYLASDDLPSNRDPGAADRLRRLLLDLPLTIDEASPLLILRTSPGGANAIARAVDLLPLDGVVGTIAGDDTIFIACRDRNALRRLRAQFEALRAGEDVPIA